MSSLMPGQTPAFVCRIPVRWGDMDAYGHVNNTVYFRFFEEACVQLIEQLASGRIAGSNHGPVIVTANCAFLRPVLYPDTVRIDCYLAEIRATPAS
ncbi:MAG: acyl-CoA thioesterase [Thiolinea sp.]